MFEMPAFQIIAWFLDDGDGNALKGPGPKRDHPESPSQRPLKTRARTIASPVLGEPISLTQWTNRS